MVTLSKTQFLDSQKVWRRLRAHAWTREKNKGKGGYDGAASICIQLVGERASCRCDIRYIRDQAEGGETVGYCDGAYIKGHKTQ
jgi:hypothetical protein